MLHTASPPPPPMWPPTPLLTTSSPIQYQISNRYIYQKNLFMYMWPKGRLAMWGDGYQVWLCDHIHNIHRLRHSFFHSPCDNFCHLCDKTYPSSVASATTLCDHSYPLCDHIHNPPPSWPYPPPVWPYPPPVWAAPCPCLHLSPVAVVTRGPAWDRGATNQIVSTHFYPGFVSWLVKLAPVAQISWHPHPSHHRPIQRLSIRIQVTSSPLHVYHLYTHMGILIADNQRTEYFMTKTKVKNKAQTLELFLLTWPRMNRWYINY